ncbi:DUF4347 domain-containing protein [Nostoc sp. DedQUE02]|uniref:DUF4347 domain-containing protein n=1 Tax=Nostoc sp. DedQUE02 TaxID=3075388 RepID=UPI002AD6B934|nr:DUF4347 domain-containing protein [Nostoc sp. DedQUE02]
MKNTSIIFIDSSVINYEILLTELVLKVETVILDSHQDGVEQITHVLSQRCGVESVHIISHGSPGCLYLGNTQLSLSTLQRYTQKLQTWFSHLCVSPSLLLYGCNVAAGDAGEEFIEKLHNLTKASIAASANLTGNAALGGDWNLEISRGEVTTAQIFKPEILETYNFVLASSNDNFANRIVLSGNSGSSTGNNVGATSESGEPTQSGTTNSVWWSWTAPASGNVVFNTIGSGFDTYLDVYTGNAVNSLSLVAANDDLASGNTASQVSFTVTAGTNYHISVDGYQTSTGNVTLNYSFSPSASNTAPTLTDTVVTLNSINEDSDTPSGAVGTLVSSLVNLGGNVSDSNNGAVTGIAITTTNTSNGFWWYSTNNGQNWYSVGTVSNSSARLLAADANTRVYFRPASNFNGTINNAITFRAWDQTSGINGNLANTSTNGGSTAFSSTTDTAAITINAVNDAPVIAPIFFNIPENLSNGTIIRTLTATDVDSNTTFSNWAIASGNIDTDGDGNQAFSINPNTGELAVNDIDDLNPQTNSIVNLQVNVSDGIVTSANQNVAIKLLLNPGGLDFNFGNGGIVTTTSNIYAKSVAIQPDGKIVVFGGFSQFDLARYNIDGSLDANFGSAGIVNTSIGSGTEDGYSVALQSDGKIVVAGYIWGDSNQPNRPDFALARYNTDGSLDSSFGNGGKLITNFGEDFGHKVLVQSDGKIILAGYIGNGNADYVLLRYNTDGSLDTSFGNGGKVNGTKGYAVAIQSDGKIVVGGRDSNGSDIKFALTRYNTDGSLDTSFGNSGRVVAAIGTVGGEVHTIAIQADGKIVAAGRVWKYVNYTSSNQNDLAIARFNTDGTLDANFGDGGKVITPLSANTDDRANSLSIQQNGKIVVGGYIESETNSLNRRTVLLAYNADGTLDSSFGTGGQVITPLWSQYDETNVVATQSDGKIVVVGQFDKSYFAVARFLGVSNVAPAIANLGYATSYTENAPAILIAESDTTVTDPDSANFHTGKLTVRIKNGGSSDDRLGIRNETQINLNGNIINYGTLEIGTFSGGTGTEDLVIDLNNNATPITVETLLRNITYVNVSQNPLTTPRTIEVVLTDGDGGISTPVTRTINVIAVNDAAMITAGQSFSINESVANGTVVGTVAATDVDGSTFSNWTIINGNLDSDRNGQLGFNINSSTGEITVNDSDDLDFETNPTFELQVTVSDGISTSSVQTVTVRLQDVRENTLSGTRSADSLRGSLADDIIYGYEGSDRLYGETGKDTIYGGISNDSLYGGTGNDILDGGDANDYLYGQDGHDRLIGNAGNDYLCGGEGNDVLDGGNGTDSLNESGDVNFTLTNSQLSGLGNDTLISIEKITLTGGITDNILDASGFTLGSVSLYGGAGNDNLFGGSKNDYLYGQDDSDRLIGNAGNDYLYGGNSDDTLDGGVGNDSLYGDNGGDRLIGGAGNDYLYGGAGDDALDGGDGIDYLNESSNVNFTLTNTQLSGLGSDTLINIEQVTLTGGISDNILDASAFSLGKVYLYGGVGNDTLTGGAGNDYLYGGNGNDLLNGGAGNDYLYGQGGADIFVLASGNGNDSIYSFQDGIDKLGLFGGLTYGALTISATGNNTSIRISSTNEVLATLTSMNPSLISENDFIFSNG